jgi:hypothetical protein
MDALPLATDDMRMAFDQAAAIYPPSVDAAMTLSFEFDDP